jgi:putative ABC transport system permease protein
MLKTVVNLRSVPLGFRPHNVYVSTLDVDPLQLVNIETQLCEPILARLKQVVGIRAAAFSTVLPIGHKSDMMMSFHLPGRQEEATALVRAATPDLLRVLGTKIISGRFVSDNDTAQSLRIMVVNKTFVREYFPSTAELVGTELRIGAKDTFMIVGVVDDMHQLNPVVLPAPEIYVSMAQVYTNSVLLPRSAANVVQVAMLVDGSPERAIQTLQKAIQEPSVWVAGGDVLSLEEEVDESIGNQRIVTALLGAFTVGGLLVTAIGIYGVLSTNLALRNRELAIRLALGSSRHRVLTSFLGHISLVVGLGLLTGIPLQLGAGKLASSLLFRVNTYDPYFLLCTVTVTLAAVAAASVGPTHKVYRITPSAILRES